MELEEDDVSLSSICRAVEQRLSHVASLSNLKLPVVPADFEKEFPGQPWMVKEPAAYRCGRILVNKQVFVTPPQPNAMVVLVHEIGHAYVDLIEPRLQDDPAFEAVPDKGRVRDYLADRLVCQWGLEEELLSERQQSSSDGPDYCEALRHWRDLPEYVKRMEKYCHDHCDPLKAPLD